MRIIVADVKDHGGYIDLRYEGRTVMVTCYINTQEDKDAIAARIGDFVKETGDNPMVIAYGGLIKPENAKQLWEEIMKAAAAGRQSEG